MNALFRKLAALALTAPLGVLIPAAASAQEAGSSGSSETQQESQAAQQPTHNQKDKEKDKTKKVRAGTGGSGETERGTEQRRTRPGTSTAGGAAGAETSVPSGGYVSPPHGQRGSPGAPEVYWPNSSTDKRPQGSTGEQAPENEGNPQGGEGDAGTNGGD